MPLFLIERQFAEQLELNDDGVAAIQTINDEVGVEWIHSFLSADQRKTYCLYQAACAEDIREAARRADLPADSVVEVAKVAPPSA